MSPKTFLIVVAECLVIALIGLFVARLPKWFVNLHPFWHYATGAALAVLVIWISKP